MNHNTLIPPPPPHYKTVSGSIILLTFLLVFPNLLYAQTSAAAAVNEETAARNAVLRLEAVTNANTASAQVIQGGSQPAWVNDPYAVYNSERYFAAVGIAPNRNQAEARALSALISIFGQSVKSDFTVVTTYTEAVEKGAVNVSENTSVQDIITTAASMDNIIGAQTGYVWDSGRGTVYAAAYIEKERTISIYSDMIIINNRNINLLTAMSGAEKYTFDGLRRYRLASNIALINENYAAIISQCGGSPSSLIINSAGFYNLEAAEIISSVTVSVSVVNDRANRIQNAFSSAISAQGLRTRGNNPPYTLEVFVFTSEAVYPNSSFKWCVMEISANLIENSTGASLIPFSLNLREGHVSYANAEARVYTMAESEIAEKFSIILRDYLASLKL